MAPFSSEFLVLSPLDADHPIDLEPGTRLLLGAGVVLDETPDWARAAVERSALGGVYEQLGEHWSLMFESNSARVIQDAAEALTVVTTVGWIHGFSLGGERHYVFARHEDEVRLLTVEWHGRAGTEGLNALDAEAGASLRSQLDLVCGFPDGTALSRALDLLGCALHQPRDEVAFLMFWTVLEALFGSDQASETSHRLAERIARFSEVDRDGILRRYESMCNSYSLRSKIVHGRNLKAKQPDLPALGGVVRETMARILGSDTLRTMFLGKDRETLLNRSVLVGL